MKKIIYFTSAVLTTATESAEIAELNARTEAGYEVFVRNGSQSASFGAGIEAADLVAGTVPTAFNAIPTYGSISSDRPSAFALFPTTAAIVGTATKQLTPISAVGKTIDALILSIPDSGIVYTSSDTAKATVNSSTGLITGVAAGTSTITATYTYATGKTIAATCAVTVS